MDDYIGSAAFRNASIARLGGAVRIPTQSFDDMGIVGEDERWQVFYRMEEYLQQRFPGVHDSLGKEVVNEHGLIFTWVGGEEGLKPLVLMAHQDVVPVPDDTVASWTFPPFSGAFDGRFVWGRGASDCKNSLVGILEAVEELVKAGYRPRRTLVLSFGFDEEVSGMEGAGRLAPFLLERYGPDGVAAIVDEGAGVNTLFGTHFATPGVAEKGYVDVEVIVRMPGGHSSIPPDHNGIGVMSELITHVESNLYSPHLDAQNPYLGLLQCGAAHSPSFPSKLRKLLSKHSSKTSSARPCCKCKQEKKDELALEAAKASPGIKYLMTTSVAVDVINGGVKTNALPERTKAIINHRINIGSHPSDAKARVATLASTIAEKYNLTLHAFPANSSSGETPRSITLRAERTELDTAPVTPTEVDGVTPYAILSGTTRALYGEEMIVAPGIMTGNTDTRYYWDLTKHIFRYMPGWDPEEEGLGNM
ncbi:peptidase family M20/M25/M40 [Venturia nashicola]|uniref:Peptidase family M20/M25/M40 n=1 Tax=Venturia nashicola TaxID=86259 RepID=A0A4Z1P3D0_9PEZI|nr:peptidase family M20/M25/M40 [Venturia nashicola]